MATLHIAIATSGLPKSSGAMPWICRVVAALANDDGVVTDHYACLVRSEDGRRIDSDATRRHGITTAMCTRGGVAERFALGMVLGFRANGTKRPVELPGLASCASAIVAWDADFIRAVIDSRYAIHGEPHGSWIRPGLQFISLQSAATAFCRLPSTEDHGGYRKPTRDEAAQALCGLPVRPLPHTVDDDLELQRVHLWPALRRLKAFDMEAA